jgi:hypothetical protein
MSPKGYVGFRLFVKWWRVAGPADTARAASPRAIAPMVRQQPAALARSAITS